MKPLDLKMLQNLDATAVVAGMDTNVLMERAGMALASYLLEHTKPEEQILFLCGVGNNAGDGFVAARHMTNHGRKISVVVVDDIKSKVAVANKNLLEHMGIPLMPWEKNFSFSPYDVIVDCLLGYSQKKAPEGIIAEAVVRANESGKRIIACDIPTGVDTTTGEVYQPHVVAAETVTFAAPKAAFEVEAARSICGTITVYGIGIPAFIYRQIGLKSGEFLVEGQQKGF